jgi:hypothetical protein
MSGGQAPSKLSEDHDMTKPALMRLLAMAALAALTGACSSLPSPAANQQTAQGQTGWVDSVYVSNLGTRGDIMVSNSTRGYFP